MKLLKQKGYEGTIQKVVDDEKTTIYGVIGTVEDLMQERILWWSDYDPDTWCLLDANGNGFFGKTKEAVLEFVK